MIVPSYEGNLRKNRIKMPEAVYKASGIIIFGKKLKSFIFSTDIAIIRNCNADAVIAVYPFTPQSIITDAIVSASDIPVFSGVGGGTTGGVRVVTLAIEAERIGAMGVVMNSPTTNEVITSVKENLEVPIIVTITDIDTDIQARLDAGADILNVSAGAKTSEVIRKIRKDFPNVPIIATGGPSDESILETIEAGANAITITPPTSASLFKPLMDNYRKK